MKRINGIVADAVRVIGVVLITTKVPAARIKPVKATPAALAQPQDTLVVCLNTKDLARSNRGRIVGVVTMMDKHFCLGIELIQFAWSTHPQQAGLVQEKRGDKVEARAVGVIGLVLVMGKGLGAGVKFVETIVSSDPKDTNLIKDHRLDEIIAQTVGLIRIVFESLNLMAIKAIEAANGGNPDKALRVLGHNIGNGVAQAMLDGQMGKYKLLLLHIEQRSRWYGF